jgi:hypothetical protein
MGNHTETEVNAWFALPARRKVYYSQEKEEFDSREEFFIMFG